VSKFIPFCPCCQSYNTDDKHQNHCLLGHAERRIAELEALNSRLAKFFITAIHCSFDGCDYDGGSIQEDALELGLIVETEPPEGEEGPWYTVAREIEGDQNEVARVTMDECGGKPMAWCYVTQHNTLSQEEVEAIAAKLRELNDAAPRSAGGEG